MASAVLSVGWSLGGPRAWSLGLVQLALVFGDLSEGLLGQMTESPTVVPRHRWWLETDIATVAWDRSTGGRDVRKVRDFTAGALLVTTGITPGWDLQAGWEGWSESKEFGEVDSTIVRGSGDAWLRAKWNFMGNETEEFSAALLPYVRVPIGSAESGAGAWEPGISFVVGAPLSTTGVWMEAMISVDAVTGDPVGRWAAWSGSGVVGLESGWYGELGFATDPRSDVRPSWMAGLGRSFELSSSLTFDLELIVGLNRSAYDVGGAFRVVWVPSLFSGPRGK